MSDAAPGKPPVLSVCLTGRNDDYGGVFVARLERALNFLAWQASRLDPVEAIKSE